MALPLASKEALFEIVKNPRHVESMTVDGVDLPLRHIQSYSIEESAGDATKVVVTFLVRPHFTYRDPEPSGDA